MSDDPFYESPLFKLISATFTEYVSQDGVFGVREFAAALGMSREGVYKWLRANRISVHGARKVVNLSRVKKTTKYRLTIEQLFPFCIPG